MKDSMYAARITKKIYLLELKYTKLLRLKKTYPSNVLYNNKQKQEFNQSKKIKPFKINKRKLRNGKYQKHCLMINEEDYINKPIKKDYSFT